MSFLRLLLSLGVGFALVNLSTIRGASPSETDVTVQDRAHWAFRKPVHSPPPHLNRHDWVQSPVDAFVLAALANAGLRPAPPTDRATLLRRVTFDLTGLPPAPEEVEAFLMDTRPDAYVRVVERLLNSPHHGERWAQHWLDVVRYAESNGYEADGERPHAWRYRDYVIRAFNQDRPYDRFVLEQLAGDELARGRAEKGTGPLEFKGPVPFSAQTARDHVDLLIAAGFSRCGPVHMVGGNTDPEVNRQEVLTEMTSAVGAAFLGMTVGCARCHDHKFDPISQADYYRLQAFFAAAQPSEIDISTDEERASQESRTREVNARLAPLRKQVAALEAPYQTRLTETKMATLEAPYREALATDAKKRTPQQQKLVADAQPLLKVTWDELVAALTPEDRQRRAEWRARIHELEAQLPPPRAAAWTLTAAEPAPATHILKRGDPKHKGAVVHPGFPRVVAERPPVSDRLDRVALARWLTQPEHPLTARVFVNRLWQHHFGRGLVATPNDFGLRGARPTHPELLDWLACEFVAHGWSVKHLHRLLVLSNTYQQATEVAGDASGKRLDPDNRLLWHMNRWRLQGEALRDHVLAVAGTLNRKQGGPMIRVPLEPEVYELIFTEGEPDGLWHVAPDPREHVRRTIYLFAKRNVRLPLLEAFDQPDTLTPCPVRLVSTFAPQALILLNGPFLQEQSKAFAARLMKECGGDDDRRIDRAYRLALSRPPRASELRMAREFLAGQTALLRERRGAGSPVGSPTGVITPGDPAAAAFADFCLALLNRNEFLYVR